MWDLDGPAAGASGQSAPHLVGYETLIDEIATNAADFKKPVLLFNGDSHTYRSDNPLLQGAACSAFKHGHRLPTRVGFATLRALASRRQRSLTCPEVAGVPGVCTTPAPRRLRTLVPALPSAFVPVFVLVLEVKHI